MTSRRQSADLYAEAILAQAPRTLGLLDRETLSPTAGCGDRTYWAWKFVDFPGARFQEAVCVLSFLYTRLEASPYHRSPKLLRWIELALSYWARIQRSDGSYDEAYPLEHSLAATAFTSFYVSEALLFLGDEVNPAVGRETLAALTRAGDWLVANDETHGFLSNHLAAAAAALAHIGKLAESDAYLVRGRYFVDKILQRQSREGWYDEYGGADPGYQTHGSFYLARYAELTGEADVRESLDRACRFLSHFIHPDRSLGGEYSSRNTKTYYPAAFEMLTSHSAAAAWIAEKMRPSVSENTAVGHAGVDAYNYFPLLNNYVFAHEALTSSAESLPPEGPSPAPYVLRLPEAGLLKIRTEAYDAFLAPKKGGVVQVFDRRSGRLALSDCGYIGRFPGGALVSTQWIDPGAEISENLDGETKTVAVGAGFFRVSRPVMDPIRFLGFRLFSLTAGRFPGPARWLKNLLVRALIYRSKQLNLRLKRSITLRPASVEIVDRIDGPDGSRLAELYAGDFFTTIHMGSARYFIPQELADAGITVDGRWPRIDVERLASGVERRSSVEIAAERAD